MKEIHLGAAESRFAEIIWDAEPIGSGELAKKAEETLGWKRTTSYTVLKRLCERGLFENEGGSVRSLTQERHSRRRRMLLPSSAGLESTTLLSRKPQ